MAALTEPASFMALPMELRLLIYDFLLAPSNAQDEISVVARASDVGSTVSFYGPGKPIHSKTLAVNKQIFDEAMPVLYKNFGFNVTFRRPCNDTPGFLDRFPNYALQHIRKLHINVPVWSILPSPAVAEKRIQTLRNSLTPIRSMLPRLASVHICSWISGYQAAVIVMLLDKHNVIKYLLSMLTHEAAVEKISIRMSNGNRGHILYAVRDTDETGKDSQPTAFVVHAWDREGNELLLPASAASRHGGQTRKGGSKKGLKGSERERERENQRKG